MFDDILQQGSFHIYLKEKRSKKISLKIEEVREGMIVAEDAYNKLGAVVVGANSVLDGNIIKRLKRLEIKELRIFEKNNDPEGPDIEKCFIKNYIANIALMKDIFQEVKEGKPPDESKVNLIAESLIEADTDYKHVIKGMYENLSIGDYEYTHSVNVAILSMLIAKYMGLTGKRMELLVKSALMHDIGKSRVSQNILSKRGSLSQKEFDEIKRHPYYGIDILKSFGWLAGEAEAGVLMHHEREDGSGYPQGLRGENIGEFAKIIAVADVFDAMTSDKAYKQKANPFEVFGYLETEAQGKMNPRVVSAFLLNAAECYVGDMFFLSSGEQCEIVHINTKRASKPIIRIKNMYVDMSKDNAYSIEKIV